MMKLLSVSAALALALMVGCGKDTEKAKTPGAANPPADENTFNLTLPTGATNVARAGEESVKIAVDRGEKMKSEITLKFEAPEGVTIEPASPKIPADADEVEVMVKAAEDAPVGEKSIKVTGEGDGKKADGTFKVEVTEAE